MDTHHKSRQGFANYALALGVIKVSLIAIVFAAAGPMNDHNWSTKAKGDALMFICAAATFAAFLAGVRFLKHNKAMAWVSHITFLSLLTVLVWTVPV